MKRIAFTLEQEEDIKSLYATGCKITHVAKQYGVCAPTIRRVLFGMNPLTRGKAAQVGRYLSWGYVMVRCPEHPRANSLGFVREHILVLEKKLGRSLTASEVSHHKDGDRQNNEPDNLEVMDRRKHTILHNQGEKSNFAKLTEADVRFIRMAQQSAASLAKHYGVSDSLIFKIRQGIIWRHVA